MYFLVLIKTLTKSKISYWKSRKQKFCEEEGCNHYCFYVAVLGAVIWAELWGTAYPVCVYIVSKTITVCWRGSDLSSLPKYYIAELILKLRTYKPDNVCTALWYVPVCPANNLVSHIGEERTKRWRQRLWHGNWRWNLPVLVGGDPKVFPAQKPV